MQSVAVGWQVYEITRRPLDLGLIGLAQFLPGMLLFLVSGHVADRFDRRKVVTLCYCGFAVCFRPAVGDRLAGQPFRPSDLRRGRAGRRGARLQCSGEPGASAPTGSGRTFSQRRGLERQHLSGGNHSRARPSADFSTLSRAGPTVVYATAVVTGRRRRIFHASNHPADPGAGARTRHLEHRAGGLPLHLEPQAGAGLDLAGHVCRSAGRRGGVAARSMPAKF